MVDIDSRQEFKMQTETWKSKSEPPPNFPPLPPNAKDKHITEMKNAVDRLISRLDTGEEGISELEAYQQNSQKAKRRENKD